jgi:hypothetical protein
MVGYGLVLLVLPIQLSTLNLDLKFELLSFIKSLVATLFCVEFVGVDLQWTWSKGPSPLPHALIGGSFLNYRAVGLTVAPIKEDT